MDVLNIIKSRIENGWGHEVAWALYGLLRNKIGYINLETEFPEIEDYLNTMNLIDEVDTDEAHELMLGWIEWILPHLQGESLDFISNDDMLSQIYQKSQFVSVKEQKEKDEKEYQESIKKRNEYLASGDPNILRDNTRHALGDLINEAKIILQNTPNNINLQTSINNARKVMFNIRNTTEDMIQATNVLQEAMANPYQVAE